MVDGAGYELDFQGNPCPVLPQVRLCYSFYFSIVLAVATLDSVVVQLKELSDISFPLLHFPFRKIRVRHSEP